MRRPDAQRGQRPGGPGGLSRTLAVGIPAVLTLVVVLAVAAFVPPQRDPVPVAAARQGRFLRQVPAEGNLRATRAVPVTAPVSPGQLRVVWLAPEGSGVEKGDVLVRFDPTDGQKNLADAQDDLETARLKIEKQRAEGAAELSRLSADERLARGEREGAERFQKKDDEIFSRAEIVESRLDEQLARERERHAHDARRIRGKVGQADLSLLGIEEEKARYRIDRAEQGLESLAVVAPQSGVLVYERDWRGVPLRVGETVWDGQGLAEIPDLSAMEAVVYVLEADAGGLAVGQPAAVELESDPGRRHPARVSRVDALAKPRLRGSPVQYFAVTLSLARTEPGKMKPGARVQASITLDDLPRAVSVPRQAVFERDGRSIVYRRGEGGGFAPVPVVPGPSGLGRMVIARGLSAGDVVALRDPSRAAAEAAAPREADSEPEAPAVSGGAGGDQGP